MTSTSDIVNPHEPAPGELEREVAELKAELKKTREQNSRDKRAMELSSNEVMHANAELQAVFSALPDLFLRIDARGMVVDRKGGGARALDHLTDPDPWNVSVHDCVVPGAAGAIQNAIDQLDVKPGATRLEYTLELGGADRHFCARAVRLPNRNALVAIEEVTEQVRAHVALLREQEDRAHELRSFAVAASHDLRAPLHNIDLLAEWVEEDIEDVEAARGHVTLLRKRVKHMKALLAGVLEYAQAGAQTVSVLEHVDTQALAIDIGDLVAPAAFVVHVSKLPTMYTGRIPLERVLLNLIANAVKHHDADKGHVHIDCEDTGAFITFRVSDDGPGIAEKDRQRAFLMFRKLNQSGDSGGAGMGLALVRRIVNRVGGDVVIDANEPRGLRVVFRWPKSWPTSLAPSSLPPPPKTHGVPTQTK